MPSCQWGTHPSYTDILISQCVTRSGNNINLWKLSREPPSPKFQKERVIRWGKANTTVCSCKAAPGDPPLLPLNPIWAWARQRGRGPFQSLLVTMPFQGQQWKNTPCNSDFVSPSIRFAPDMPSFTTKYCWPRNPFLFQAVRHENPRFGIRTTHFFSMGELYT